MNINKKILLLAPVFMKYEKEIENELCRRGCDVYFVNNEECLNDIRKVYKSRSFMQKILHKLFPALKNKYKEKILDIFLERYLGKIDIKNEKFNIIININGHYVPDMFYQLLKNENPDAEFILYVWDDVKNIFKSSHFRFFDKKYSYNVDDCRKFSCDYFPMFVQFGVFPTFTHRKYDICVIATTDKERVRYIRQIYEMYKNIFSFYIYMYDRESQYDFFSHKEPMCFIDYLSILANAKCTLDIGRNNQSGPTTRFFDALITKTKVITTNRDIVKYPVYSENICIIDKNSPEITFQFVNKEYKEIEIYPYDIGTWITKLIT